MTKKPHKATFAFGVYAEPGAGKTELVASMARWIHKTYGGKTRVAYSDTSVDPLLPLEEAGIVETMQVDQWQYPWLVLGQLSNGFWPEDPKIPNSPLLPGIRQWRKCPKCGEDSGSTHLLFEPRCLKCKADVSKEIAKVPVEIDCINGFEDVWGLAFEGMSSFGKLLMYNQGERQAKGETIGVIQKSNDGGPATTKFADGPEGSKVWIGGNTWSHISTSQDYLHKFVKNSKALPVHTVMWTALETKTTELGEKGSRPCFAPDLPGEKRNAFSLSWLYHFAHLDLVEDGKEPGTGIQKYKRMLYFQKHWAPNELVSPFLARTSTPAGSGFPLVMEANMALFYEEHKKAMERSKIAPSLNNNNPAE